MNQMDLDDVLTALVQGHASDLGMTAPKLPYEAPKLTERFTAAHGCASCDELTSLEDAFCIESDYADDEIHPVCAGMTRLSKVAAAYSALNKVLNEKLLALRAREVEEGQLLQTYELKCRHCQRVFCKATAPAGIEITPNCRGCELEGRL